MLKDQTEAHFNARAGRAIVYTADRQIFLLEVTPELTINEPMAPESGSDLVAWLQPIDSRRVEFDIGEYPFTTLQTYMVFKVSLGKLLDHFTHATNPAFELPFRSRCAFMFERQYARVTADVTAEFRRLMLETPMPDGMDENPAPFKPSSQGVKIFAEMLARWRPTP